MTDPKDWPLPMTGGLYLRDPVTGALTKVDETAEVPPAPEAVSEAAPATVTEPAPEDPAPRARKVKEA